MLIDYYCFVGSDEHPELGISEDDILDMLADGRLKPADIERDGECLLVAVDALNRALEAEKC